MKDCKNRGLKTPYSVKRFTVVKFPNALSPKSYQERKTERRGSICEGSTRVTASPSGNLRRRRLKTLT